MVLFYLIIVATAFTRGYFTPSAWFLVLVFLVLFLADNFRLLDLSKIKVPISFSLVVFSSMTLLMGSGIYQSGTSLIFLYFTLGFCQVLLSTVIFLNDYKKHKGRFILYFVLLAFAMRILMLVTSTAPRIDVFEFLKNGTIGLLSGQNPYSITYAQLYEGTIPDYFYYFPGIIFLVMPAVKLFEDPRLTFVFAEILVFYLIYRHMKKSKESLSSLLILLNPLSLFIIEQSYTEPILLLLILLVYLNQKKLMVSGILTGIFLTTKQYSLLCIPILLNLYDNFTEKIKYAFTALAVFVVITLPFFLWNKSDFIHDVFLLQFSGNVKPESLSFVSMGLRLGIPHIQEASFLIMIILLLVFFLRPKARINYFYHLSLLLFLAFFFNKWIYSNYYYLISQLLLLSAIIEKRSHE